MIFFFLFDFSLGSLNKFKITMQFSFSISIYKFVFDPQVLSQTLLPWGAHQVHILMNANGISLHPQNQRLPTLPPLTSKALRYLGEPYL